MLKGARAKADFERRKARDGEIVLSNEGYPQVKTDRRHLVEAAMVQQHLTGQDGCLDKVEDKPFYPAENVGTVTFQGPVVPEVAPTTKRRIGCSTPWDGMAAKLPWGVPGSPRTSACI